MIEALALVIAAIILGTAADRAIPKRTQPVEVVEPVEIKPFVCVPVAGRGEFALFCAPLDPSGNGE